MDVNKGKTGVIIRIIILLNVTVMLVNALECYSCYGTGGNNECEKYETYKDARKKKPRLFKNCTAPYNVVCMIEKYESQGYTVSHIRDCSNGVNFSFGTRNTSNPVVYDRLFDLDMDTNNETACVWNGQHQVCLSLCSKDHCNGPNHGADTHAVSFTILSVNFIVFILREMF